jgi:hypothetical protein
VLTQQQIATLERKFGLNPSTMACRDEDGCEHCRRPGLFTRSGKVAAGIKGQTLAMSCIGRRRNSWSVSERVIGEAQNGFGALAGGRASQMLI